VKQAFLICFGLGGHFVETVETGKDGRRVKGHTSGYDSPESFERALGGGEKADYPPLAGVPVLDKRKILRKEPMLSFRSPLVGVDLKDDEIERVDTEAARNMLPGLSGGFETLAAAAIAHGGKKEPGPLDTVSLQAYVRWWTARGARLGRMNDAGLRIVWADQSAVAP
jgi:hypothetical protein